MEQRKMRLLSLGKLIIILLLTCSFLNAGKEKVAAIFKVKGNVKVKQSGSKSYSSAYIGQMLMSGDWMKTEDGGFAAIIFLDGSQLKIRENSELELKSQRFSSTEQSTFLYLVKGDMWTRVKKRKGEFEIATPVSVASVKGTEFNLSFDDVDKITELFVIEGIVEFHNELGSILVKEMTYSMAKIGEAPTPPKKVSKSKLPTWQKAIEPSWGFKITPEKSGKQPINEPLKVTIQVVDIKKNENAYSYKDEVTVSSGEGHLQVSLDGSSWAQSVTMKPRSGKGTVQVKAVEEGKSSIVVSAENAGSRKLNLDFHRTKTQKRKTKSKLDRLIEKKGFSEIKEKIGDRNLKSSHLLSGSGDIDDILQKVDTGELEIVDIIQVENPDGTISVKLKVKPRKQGVIK